MHWTERRQRFRALLEGARCIRPASVFDPVSARIAEDLGFEAGMLAGSVASFTVLGAPDLMLLSLAEFAGQAYRINRAAGLPLLVDADHGYGNALAVMRTVEELETAGVAALTIEDTLLPPSFGAATQTRLISIEEGVGKLRAALRARQDPALAIIGRTSAVSVTSLEDAIARARAYAALGIDGLFFVGVRSRAQLDAITAAIDRPILLGGVGAELDEAGYLAGKGVRVALQGHLPFLASVQAVHDSLKALREGQPPAKIAGAASGELMRAVTRERRYQEWIGEFL